MNIANLQIHSFYLSNLQKNIFHHTSLPLGPETVLDFADAAEKTVNTVVHVKTVYEGQTETYRDPFYDFLWGGGSSK